MKKLAATVVALTSFLTALVAFGQPRTNSRPPRTAAEAERLAPTPPPPPPTPPAPTENDRVCTTGRAYSNALVTFEWTEELDPRDALHARLLRERGPTITPTSPGCSIIRSIPPSTVTGIAFAPGTSGGVDPDEIYAVPGGWTHPADTFGYGGLLPGNAASWLGTTAVATEQIYTCNVTLLRLRAQYPATAFCRLAAGTRPADGFIRGRVTLVATSRAHRPLTVH